MLKTGKEGSDNSNSSPRAQQLSEVILQIEYHSKMSQEKTLHQKQYGNFQVLHNYKLKTIQGVHTTLCMPYLTLCEPLTCSFFLLPVMLPAGKVLLECLLDYSCILVELPISLVFQQEQLRFIQALRQCSQHSSNIQH